MVARFFKVYQVAIWGMILLSILLFIQGCGFQLNRNKIQLPDLADSIAIAKIENKSYVPRLDIKLKSYLIDRFNANSITVSGVGEADLALSFSIQSMSLSRDEYSLDDSGQNYEFKFVISGVLNVFDNRTNTFFKKDQAMTKSYSVITAESDLTTTEIEEGREKLLKDLSVSIAAELTDTF